MQASSSSGSSSTHRQSNSIHERPASKHTLTDLQLTDKPAQHDTEALTPSGSDRWAARLEQKLTGHPRIYKALIYFRGPRPKVDLPDPQPFLDIDITIKGRRIYAPIESTLIHHTRRLTASWLFIVLVAGYIIGLAFFSRAESFQTPSDAFIGCTSTFWLANSGCGLNGESCTPFTATTYDFRCPAGCTGVILQNPRTVGNEQTAFVPLVVGGGDADATYRGDSFICAAAIQQGLISNDKGGCASVSLIGNYTNFLPTSAHGITSIGFETVFPLAYRFLDETSLSHCEDLRDPALAFNILVTCLLFLLLRPRPIIMLWCLVCIGFWHITLFSQPQSTPPNLSAAFATFLPALFIAYGFWRLAFRFTLYLYLKAPIEFMIYYLAPFWTGVLTNMTLNEIPISRLTSSDLRKRSGAITALVIIIIIVVVLVINQVRVVRKTGWLPYYVGWYVAGGLVALVLAMLPGLEFRLHHYIIGIVLMPVTGFPTRPSAIYQGFLLGLFLNGGAAFGFDSILQTAEELRQDSTLGSDLPSFITNSSNFNASMPFSDQTIFWAALPEGWDGVSLLVDDVERYVGTALNISLAAFNASIPHFFRLALTSGSSTGDFTMPATLWPNGTWVDPLPGASF
ncbi:hypothetical protein BDZ89DRAFT_996314 [Hymenopellis radicata]|nr:hypothetical protein BDZ89DRAFT_996314 [Hymenopellis radicata]